MLQTIRFLCAAFQFFFFQVECCANKGAVFGVQRGNLPDALPDSFQAIEVEDGIEIVPPPALYDPLYDQSAHFLPIETGKVIFPKQGCPYLCIGMLFVVIKKHIRSLLIVYAKIRKNSQITMDCRLLFCPFGFWETDYCPKRATSSFFRHTL